VAESRAAVVTAINKPLEIQNVPIPKLDNGALLHASRPPHCVART